MRTDPDADDLFFEQLACVPDVPVRASSRLKSKVYSALMRRAAQDGPLRSLTEIKTAGHGLCVFEQAVQTLRLGHVVDSMNYCRVCHARLLAESVDRAPLAWRHCPYAEFQKK